MKKKKIHVRVTWREGWEAQTDRFEFRSERCKVFLLQCGLTNWSSLKEPATKKVRQPEISFSNWPPYNQSGPIWRRQSVNLATTPIGQTWQRKAIGQSGNQPNRSIWNLSNRANRETKQLCQSGKSGQSGQSVNRASNLAPASHFYH